MAGLVRTSFNPNKKHSDLERWVCIYPAYIDSHKTKVEGRRISKKNAVERPTREEIRDVLAAANFNVKVDLAKYSREESNEIEKRGRVRVQLRNDDGTPVNPKFPSRDSLLLHLGDKIPQLKTRVFKSGGEGQSSSQGGASGGGGKKKGKGGRK